MWSMSNSPAASRTRTCSSRGPVPYWMGMSHPPKSTIRAPARRCQPCSLVIMLPPLPQKKGNGRVPVPSVMGLRDCSRAALSLLAKFSFRSRRWCASVGNAPSAAARSRVRGGPCGDFPECRPSAILLPESFSGPSVGPLFAPSAIPGTPSPAGDSVRLQGFSRALFFRQDAVMFARAERSVKTDSERPAAVA